jgi:endonuclease IV
MIGLHVSKTFTIGKKHTTRSMSEALRHDINIIKKYIDPDVNPPCVQIFVVGPQSFKPTVVGDEITACKEVLDSQNCACVIHGAYVDNPWGDKPTRNGAIHNIKYELDIAAQIGASGVIIHLGNNTMQGNNLQYVLERIDTTLDPSVMEKTILWLEIHAAKQSAGTFETVEKLRALFDTIESFNLKHLRVGLCVDTAHLFSCGLSLNTYDIAMQWFENLSKHIKVNIMLHLNDSASTLGSGKDEHSELTEGKIWGEYSSEHGKPIEDSGLLAILNWAQMNKTMIILERNYDGAVRDLARVQELL